MRHYTPEAAMKHHLLPIPPVSRSVIHWRSAVQLCVLSISSVWAGGLILLGMGLWRIDPRLALGPLAAGEFLLMALIADRLCPRASVSVTGFLKLAAALVFWLVLGVYAYTALGTIW